VRAVDIAGKAMNLARETSTRVSGISASAREAAESAIRSAEEATNIQELNLSLKETAAEATKAAQEAVTIIKAAVPKTKLDFLFFIIIVLLASVLGAVVITFGLRFLGQ
ncbi:hypothetical protein ACFLV4_07680, partial [Chloroflexota bacterium]